MVLLRARARTQLYITSTRPLVSIIRLLAAYLFLQNQLIMSAADIRAINVLENTLRSLPLVNLMPVIKSHLGKPNFRPAFVHNPLQPTSTPNFDALLLFSCLEGLVRLSEARDHGADTTLDANADFLMNEVVRWLVALLLDMPSHIFSQDEKHVTTRNLHFYLYALLTTQNILPLFSASPFIADCASAVVESFIHVLRRDEMDSGLVADLIFRLNLDPKARWHMCATLRRQPSRLLFRPIRKMERISEVLKAYPNMKFPVDLVMRVLHYAGSIGAVDVELREDLWKRNALDSVVTLIDRYLDTFPPSPCHDDKSMIRLSMCLRMLSSLHDYRGDVPDIRTKGWTQSLDAGLVEVVAKAVRVLSSGDFRSVNWLSSSLKGFLVNMGIYTICSRVVAVRMARELARVLAENMDGLGDSRVTDCSTPLRRSWAAFIGMVQKVTRLDPETGEVTLICMNPKCDQSYTSECRFKRCSECYSFIVCSEECWDEVGGAKLHTKAICKESAVTPHFEAWYPEICRFMDGDV